MSSDDHVVSINASSNLPTVGQTLKKPPHLVVIQSMPGLKGIVHEEFFIALDKPDFTTAPGCMLVRGFDFRGTNEQETIAKEYLGIIAEIPKEDIQEVFFPMHRVLKVRSLVYRSK